MTLVTFFSAIGKKSSMVGMIYCSGGIVYLSGITHFLTPCVCSVLCRHRLYSSCTLSSFPSLYFTFCATLLPTFTKLVYTSLYLAPIRFQLSCKYFVSTTWHLDCSVEPWNLYCNSHILHFKVFYSR